MPQSCDGRDIDESCGLSDDKKLGLAFVHEKSQRSPFQSAMGSSEDVFFDQQVVYTGRKVWALLRNRNAKQTVFGFRRQAVEKMFQRQFSSSAYDRYLWLLRLICCVAMIWTPLALLRVFADASASTSAAKLFVLLRLGVTLASVYCAWCNWTFRQRSYISRSVLYIHRGMLAMFSFELLCTDNIHDLSEMRGVLVVWTLQTLIVVPSMAEFIMELGWVSSVVLKTALRSDRKDEALGMVLYAFAVLVGGIALALHSHLDRREQWLRHNNVWKKRKHQRETVNPPEKTFAFKTMRASILCERYEKAPLLAQRRTKNGAKIALATIDEESAANVECWKEL
mmetsp:Transcript_60269/g.141988  ORF Transcript_60269/g.141988 Transcript_60269/m.141988 type:complete len:339 (-) Transcript_60269:40-1056(-)